MLPKTHILLGALFTILLYFLFPSIPLYGLILIFLASFLIDFDHYMAGAIKIHSLNFKKIVNYHKINDKIAFKEREKGIRKKADFHIFHTIEFILLVYVLSFLFKPLFYVLVGMVFHSILDLISLVYHDFMYRREFFLTNWIVRRIEGK